MKEHSSNVDSALLEKFYQVKSPQQVLEFVAASNLPKIISNWSYFISINDHSQFLRITNKLSEFTGLVNSVFNDNNDDLSNKLAILEYKQAFTDCYLDMLNNHTKIFMKCLNNRPNLINPILSLLTNVIEFPNYIIVNEVLNNFDFNSSFLTKLPSNSNKLVRSKFIIFWFKLCSITNSFIRKDLLLISKLMNNIWKSLEEDSAESLSVIISFINDKICHDTNFKKSTKSKILNENFLHKFSLLLNKIDQPVYSTCQKEYHDLFNLLVTDLTYGLRFPINNNGIDLSINNKNFKLNNKVIYTLLTFLKPWESHSHLNLCIAILSSNLELIAPYSNWIVANGGGFHDPSLTSWWIGHTLLYSRILSIPNLSKADQISLAPLSKSSLMKCLELKNLLIVQLSLQLIFLQLNHLSNVDSTVIEIVLGNFPNLSYFTNFLNHENKIIKLTISMILSSFEKFKSSNISIPLSDLNLENKYDLILLNNYLSIQSKDFKWFNKSQNSNSFFTNLLKLGNSKLFSKIFLILSNLTKDTLIFNSNLIESPLIPLILLGIPNNEVAKLIDETISRSIKFPYKYLDISHQNHNDLSLFIVVLFEQLNYIERTPEIQDWLDDLCGKLVLIGESEIELKKLNPSTKIKLENINQPISKFQFGNLFYKLNNCSNEKEIMDIFLKLGNYIVSDNSLNKFVSSEKFWGHFFKSDNVLVIHLLNELFQNLDVFKNLEQNEFQTFVFEKLKNNEIMKLDFTWLLTNHQLIELTNSNNSDPNIYQELINRKIDIKPNFQLILKPEFESILKSYQIPLSLIENDLKTFKNLLPNVSPQSDLLNLKTKDEDLLIFISSFYKPFFDKHLEIVPSVLKLQDPEFSIKIFNHSFDKFNINDLSKVVQNFVKGDLKKLFTPEFVELIGNFQIENIPFINDWLYKTILYITKKFAESTELSSKFDSFLIKTDQINFSKLPILIINSQLEVILNSKDWINNEIYLNHAYLLINSKSIQYEKLLQIFINNEHNSLFQLPTNETREVRIKSALIIERLFNLNPLKNSTESLLDNILNFYLGSIRKDDLVLKNLMKTIETNINKSWIHKVSNWDFANSLNESDLELVGFERLFIRDKSSFILAISKNFIINTVNNINISDALISYNYIDTIYDAEFLLLLIINNDELISEINNEEENVTQIKIDLKKLIESSLLQFIIANLSNSNKDIVNITKVLLNGMLKSIELQEFKDKNIFQVYLCNILNTLKSEKFEHYNSLIWYSYASLVPILSNPGHFLYEKVFRYILSNPTISEIPLFKSISNPFADEEELSSHDLYYRQINWLITDLIHGTKQLDDLNIIRLKKIIEWLMNINNSLYAPFKTKQLILNYIYNLQKLNNGSDLLITRFAILSNFEIIRQSLQKDNLIDEQLKLNIDQILLRFGITFQSNKRIKDWTANDLPNVIKRVHT